MGAVGQLGPADAVREAEIVLDPRALPGLPPGRPSLDQDRAQALRGRVHGGAEPGRTTTDDDDVVEVGGGRRREPDPGCQLADAGGEEMLARRASRRAGSPCRRPRPPPAAVGLRVPRSSCHR